MCLRIEYCCCRLSERPAAQLETSVGPQSLQSELTDTEATLRAQLALRERELAEVRGAKEQLTQLQATNRELERNNLRLNTQQHSDRKEIMRSREVLGGAPSNRLSYRNVCRRWSY